MAEKAQSFLASLFSAKQGTISSKRFCGVIIIFVIMFSYVWAVITEQELPSITGEIIIVGASLLGIDSVTKIWRKDKPE